MKQVYLTGLDDDAGECSSVFSSKTKAISQCNRIFDKPDFKWVGDYCTVSVNSLDVGWIAKKMVQ